jgi:uncharacterized phage-associated protein
MANVQDVAAYILRKQGAMSAMKLQKLVYYCQAWHLVFDGEPLFESDIQAWANGPVVRDLYSVHRGLFIVGESHFPKADATALTDPERETVDAVLKAYAKMDAHQLSNLTHSERPWIEAREGVPTGRRSTAVISRATMLEFYNDVLD